MTFGTTVVQLRKSVIKSLEFVRLQNITLDVIRAMYLTYVEFNKNQENE